MDTGPMITAVRNERGITAIYIALAISVLVGFLGLAVDMGHLQLVRGELQNAADASALAGAGCLYKQEPGALPTLDWEGARMMAVDYVKRNKSDGATLADGAIEVGYWDLNEKKMQPTTITPEVGVHVPAVAVTVARAGGSNGGQVASFFAQVLGLDSVPVSSRQAVVMRGFPASIPAETAFPMVLSKCMTDDIFSRPPSEWPNPIQINSPYLPGGATCFSGQWTSFLEDISAAKYPKDVLAGTQSTPAVQTGDNVFVQPGAEAALFNAVSDWLPADGTGKDVLLAIVDTGSSDLKSKGEYPITGFAKFHIDGAVGGSDKYIYGHFIEYYPDYQPGTQPGGTSSNTLTPPIMVR